jgi:beta-N-acetylhexosaminidase
MLKKIGQLFITGFDSPEPSEEFLEFLSEEDIGGIILFEEQCNPHSLAESNIKKCLSALKTVPFIGVDQEGGRVCRLRGTPAEFNEPEEYGRKNNIELFEEHYSRALYYLSSLGINLNFAPVVDLRLNRSNTCLEGRSFGSSPARVIPFIEKAVKIANKVGIISCLKHFPGFGAAGNDPHKVLATADYDYQTFINREALVFKAGMGVGADMIMTTHLFLPLIDSQHPATFSQKIVQNLLKQNLGFDGIAITDDLLMAGAEKYGNYGDRALAAFQAGHDLALFGRDFRAARAAVLHFKDAYRNGIITDDRLELSLDRISGIKSKLAAPVI